MTSRRPMTTASFSIVGAKISVVVAAGRRSYALNRLSEDGPISKKCWNSAKLLELILVLLFDWELIWGRCRLHFVGVIVGRSLAVVVGAAGASFGLLCSPKQQILASPSSDASYLFQIYRFRQHSVGAATSKAIHCLWMMFVWDDEIECARRARSPADTLVFESRTPVDFFNLTRKIPVLKIELNFDWKINSDTLSIPRFLAKVSGFLRYPVLFSRAREKFNSGWISGITYEYHMYNNQRALARFIVHDHIHAIVILE